MIKNAKPNGYQAVNGINYDGATNTTSINVDYVDTANATKKGVTFFVLNQDPLGLAGGKAVTDAMKSSVREALNGH